jgi:cytochrome c oxidase subunit 2
VRFSARLGAALALFAVGLTLVPTAVAETVWDDSITPVGDIIRPMFQQIVWVSVVVGVFVWVLLVYALVKFRQRPDSPKDSPDQTHGNNKLEIAWTIAPAIVMAWLLVISYNGLVAIDGPDRPEPDFIIEVTGHQWFWTFVYPDGNETQDAIRVEEGQIVGLLITSADVIHAFRIADLDVMVDALPGKETYAWFQARETGTFKAACFQFCGAAHGDMVAEVEVFAAGSQDIPYGDPPGEAPEPTPPAPGGDQTGGNQTEGNQTNVEADEAIDVALRDFRFNHPDPAPFRVEPGQVIAFNIVNEDPAPHNMYVGTYAKAGEGDRQVIANSNDLNPNENEVFVVEFPDEVTTLDIWCNVPGHADQLGMITRVGIGQDAEDGGASGEDPILPGPAPLLLVGALGAAAYLARRRRD